MQTCYMCIGARGNCLFVEKDGVDMQEKVVCLIAVELNWKLRAISHWLHGIATCHLLLSQSLIRCHYPKKHANMPKCTCRNSTERLRDKFEQRAMAKDYKRKETCVNVQNRELPHVITMGHGKRHKYSQEKNKKKKKNQNFVVDAIGLAFHIASLSCMRQFSFQNLFLLIVYRATTSNFSLIFLVL